MSADEHRWVRMRFAARRAGLLTDSEEQRMAEHLTSCDRCREAWESDSATAEDGDAHSAAPVDTHIPAGVLAVWPRSSEKLRGLERALVRQHLERCESCRQELEMLGYEPSLATVPELEWSGAMSPKEIAEPPMVDRAVPEPAHVIRVFKLAPKRRDWTRWAFGGWAAVASAAALLLVVNPGLIGRDGEGGPPSSPGHTPPESATETSAPPAPASLLLAGRPLRLRSALRGESAPLPERTIAANSRVVPISVEPLDLPDTSRVEVTIQLEGGPAILRATVPNGELASGRLLLTSGGDPLRPGTYIVRLRGGPGPDAVLPEPEVAEYRFVLRIATP